MAASVWVAVLAHAHRPALEDLLESVSAFLPEADVVVYNGGTDHRLTDGLDVARCSYSQPLSIGNLVPFHWGVMRWLDEHAGAYDYLVTVDWDVLFVRAGLRGHLDRVMADSAFMGAGYLEAPPWYPEWDCARRINYGWRRWWRPLFGTEYPSWAFNPGLVFRKEYADRAARLPAWPRILARAAHSRIYGIEEWVYATLAVTLGCNPVRNPGSAGLHNRRLAPAEIRGALANPDVFVVHKIGAEMDAPDRVALRGARAGAPVGGAPAGPLPDGPDPGGRTAPPNGWMHSGREVLKDLYFRVLP